MAYRTGSPVDASLGRIDTRPIMQAAQAQSQAMQSLGRDISAGIQQYNKKKEKKQQSDELAKFIQNEFGVSEEDANASVGSLGDDAFTYYANIKKNAQAIQKEQAKIQRETEIASMATHMLKQSEAGQPMTGDGTFTGPQMPQDLLAAKERALKMADQQYGVASRRNVAEFAEKGPQIQVNQGVPFLQSSPTGFRPLEETNLAAGKEFSKSTEAQIEKTLVSQDIFMDTLTNAMDFISDETVGLKPKAERLVNDMFAAFGVKRTPEQMHSMNAIQELKLTIPSLIKNLSHESGGRLSDKDIKLIEKTFENPDKWMTDPDKVRSSFKTVINTVVRANESYLNKSGYKNISKNPKDLKRAYEDGLISDSLLNMYLSNRKK